MTETAKKNSSWCGEMARENETNGRGFYGNFTRLLREWREESDATIRTFELIKHLHLFHQFCEIFPWVFAKNNGEKKNKRNKKRTRLCFMHFMSVDWINIKHSKHVIYSGSFTQKWPNKTQLQPYRITLIDWCQIIPCSIAPGRSSGSQLVLKHSL